MLRVSAPGPLKAALLAAGLLALLLTALLSAGLGCGVWAQPRAWLFVAAMTAAAGVEAGFAARWPADPRPGGEAADPGPVALLSALTGLYLLALTLAPLVVWRQPSAMPGGIGTLAGAVFAASGIVLRALAIRRLGGRFNSTNAIAPDAALETGGVYRLLAHPSELGLMLLVAGALLLIGSWPLGLSFALFYGLLAARVRLEEMALCKRHGDIYKAYRGRRMDPIPSFGAWRVRGKP